MRVVWVGAIVLAVTIVVARTWWRRKLSVRQAALNILGSMIRNYPPSAEYQVLTPDRIAPAVHEKVASLAREFEQFGFRLVCLYENMTLGSASGKFVPQWYYVSSDAPQVGATVFHFPPLEHPTAAFETRLSDGRLLVTSNAGATIHAPRPPEIEKQVLASGTPVAEVLARHRELLQLRLGERAGLELRVPLTAEGLFDENQRQVRDSHAFRKQIGWVTEEELVGNANGKDALARQVFREIQRLLSAGYDPLAALLPGADGLPLLRIDADDPAVNQAMVVARSTVTQFLSRLHAPQAGDAAFAVKVMVRDGAACEHIWVNELRVEQETFVGRINNTPTGVHTVREGQEWRTPTDEISDWTFINGERMYGNFTLRAAQAKLPPTLREAFTKRFADLPETASVLSQPTSLHREASMGT